MWFVVCVSDGTDYMFQQSYQGLAIACVAALQGLTIAVSVVLVLLLSAIAAASYFMYKRFAHLSMPEPNAVSKACRVDVH